MAFTLGSLAVISGFRPLEQSSLLRFSALFELRSLLLSVLVFFVILVLGMYLFQLMGTFLCGRLTQEPVVVIPLLISCMYAQRT